MGLYVIPRRLSWFDTVSGRVDALVTMSLMQMVADAYEGAHSMWEYDDKPKRSLPNEAQKAIRSWLAYAHFLPPLPRKRLLPIDPFSMLTGASSSTISNPPKTPTSSKKWRMSLGSLKLPRKNTRSGSTNPSRSSLSLSPSNFWRRRRESNASFATVSDFSTPPSTPQKSSRSLPVRSYTTPAYKKRPRFPTKTPYRQESTFDEIQDPLSPQSLTRTPSSTRQYTRTLSFDGTTPWLTRSISSPCLKSPSPSSKPPLRSTQNPVLDKNLSENRPPDITLWTLFVITMLGYLFFLFLFFGCFLMAISKLFGIFWSATDE